MAKVGVASACNGITVHVRFYWVPRGALRLFKGYKAMG